MSKFQEFISLVDADFLSIYDLAMLLGCSVDTVRRIPRDWLPVYRVGKCNIYIRDDVIRYLRRHCRVQPRPEINELVSEIEAAVVGSPSDGVRERSQRRTL